MKSYEALDTSDLPAAAKALVLFEARRSGKMVAFQLKDNVE